MKRLFSPILALTVLFASTASAQDAMPAPQLLSIFTAHTKLGHGPQYEAAVKSLWVAMGKAGGQFPVFASQSTSTPGDYSFVTLLSSIGDMDTQGEMFEKAFAQDPGALAELAKHENGNDNDIVAMRSDLSYQAAEPRLSDDEAQFAYLTYLYAQSEHTQSIEAGITAFAALNKKLGINDRFGVFQNVTGEGPVYIIRTLARSQADNFAQVDKNNAKLGEEGVAIRTRVAAMLSRIEYDSGVARPDLSYQPQP